MALMLVIVAGLCFGSFITLASHRLPIGEGIVRGASRCPQCSTALTARDLFPVFSYLAAKARCRHCGAGVHWRYPAIELITAALFALIYALYGLTPQAAMLALLAVMLMILIVADFEHYIIPDAVHVVLLPLGVLYRLYACASSWGDMASGLALGLGIGLALRYGYSWVKKQEGLGLGDVKFLAVAGLWLGVEGVVPFLFLSGILGIVTAILWRVLSRGLLFPFGPALAASMFLCVLFPAIPGEFWNVQRWALL